LSHVASDAATQIAGIAAPFEAANQDAVAQSAHSTAKHTLLSNLGDQGFQQGLSGLQAYSSQSESDSSSSGCDRSGSGAVGPFFWHQCWQAMVTIVGNMSRSHHAVPKLIVSVLIVRKDVVSQANRYVVSQANIHICTVNKLVAANESDDGV